MVEIEGLKRHFGKVEALKGIDLVAEQGKVTGLLGPNGAGKTTTIRILSTIIKPHGGTARVMGHDIQKEPATVRKLLGVVFEDSGIYRRLTGIENILYFAQLADVPMKDAKARMEQMFELLGVDYAHRLAGSYSKGMAQKINLIRSIIHNPPVVILDEPTAGLDVPSTRAVEIFIKQMREEGKTVILSTHLMAQVEKLCDYIYIIHKGKIVEKGTPAEIKEKWNSTTVEEAFLKVVSGNVE